MSCSWSAKFYTLVSIGEVITSFRLADQSIVPMPATPVSLWTAEKDWKPRPSKAQRKPGHPDTDEEGEGGASDDEADEAEHDLDKADVLEAAEEVVVEVPVGDPPGDDATPADAEVPLSHLFSTWVTS